MTHIKFLPAFALAIVLLTSCGRAGEDREAMYARAKVFQDSIANVIKSSMDEAAAPADPMTANTATQAAPQATTGN